MNFRIGIGYDVHALVEGSFLRVGGVNIPSSVRAVGHSDADVLVHAIMDACLGAAGLPDIGHYFPPSDPSYQGVDSMKLLHRVVQVLHQKGWKCANVDSVVILEKPRLAPHIPAMKERIAHAMDLSPLAIGIKATTNEQLGFIGRHEGIAAQAVALIVRNKSYNR